MDHKLVYRKAGNLNFRRPAFLYITIFMVVSDLTLFKVADVLPLNYKFKFRFKDTAGYLLL